jgi:hypothetical protein
MLHHAKEGHDCNVDSFKLQVPLSWVKQSEEQIMNQVKQRVELDSGELLEEELVKSRHFATSGFSSTVGIEEFKFHDPFKKCTDRTRMLSIGLSSKYLGENYLIGLNKDTIRNAIQNWSDIHGVHFDSIDQVLEGGIANGVDVKYDLVIPNWFMKIESTGSTSFDISRSQVDHDEWMKEIYRQAKDESNTRLFRRELNKGVEFNFKGNRRHSTLSSPHSKFYSKLHEYLSGNGMDYFVDSYIKGEEKLRLFSTVRYETHLKTASQIKSRFESNRLKDVFLENRHNSYLETIRLSLKSVMDLPVPLGKDKLGEEVMSDIHVSIYELELRKRVEANRNWKNGKKKIALLEEVDQYKRELRIDLERLRKSRVGDVDNPWKQKIDRQIKKIKIASKIIESQIDEDLVVENRILDLLRNEFGDLNSSSPF